MWGVEWLWPELLLVGAGLSHRWRWLPPVFILGYGVAAFGQREIATALFYTSEIAVEMLSAFAALTALVWILHPLKGAAAWALLLQLGSYGLLLRSSHLAFTWTLMESAAIGGYFFVVGAHVKPDRWETVIRYLTWSVTASALVFLGIAFRLAAEKPITYPLSSGGYFSDMLLLTGWSIKIGFLPWHFWLISLYRSLPVVWGGWFAAVPKGALLLNLLSALKAEGLHLEVVYALGAVSLLGAYALAWKAAERTEMIFWGSFAQSAYLTLAMTEKGAFAGWKFWLVYSVATLSALLYAQRPWRGQVGSAVGLLILANLAALPPVLGFWVKLQLFWAGIEYLPLPFRWLLIGTALIGTIGGFAVYGKVLWYSWENPEKAAPNAFCKILYLSSGLALMALGLRGLG